LIIDMRLEFSGPEQFVDLVFRLAEKLRRHPGALVPSRLNMSVKT
jgi:hypothetical protein